MLRFFRINDPYRLVFIFLLLILIRFGQSYFIVGTSYFELKYMLLGEWLNKGFFLYSEAYDYTGPLAAFIYKALDQLFGRSAFAHHAINAIIVVLQAGIFNQILLKNKAYDENSYVPAFLFMIIMVMVPDFMALSPQLLSLTFILLAFRNVLRRIDNQVTDELFLNSGVFIGIATMIYLPAAVYYLVFLVSLILFSSAVLRRLLLYSFGFLLTFSLCALYFYWIGTLPVFIDSFLVSSLLQSSSELLNSRELLFLAAPFLLVFMIAVLKTWGAARLTNYQQKIQQVIWLMFLGGIGAALLSNEKAGNEFVYTVPVIAYFLTHYFILLRRKIFRRVMPFLLLSAMIGYSFYVYATLLGGTVVLSEIPAKEGTMVLGERLDYYKEIEVNTPCFNQALSEKAFAGLNYYEDASRIFDLVRRADPQFIIDEMNVIEPLFHRFPSLEKDYKKISATSYQKISN